MPGLVILVSIQGSDAASSAVMVGTCVAKDAWRVGAIVRLTGRSREVVSVSLNKSSACTWLSAALIQNTHTHVDISFSHGMWFYVRILLVACRSPNKSQRTSSSRERSKHNNTKRMVRHACRGGGPVARRSCPVPVSSRPAGGFRRRSETLRTYRCIWVPSRGRGRRGVGGRKATGGRRSRFLSGPVLLLAYLGFLGRSYMYDAKPHKKLARERSEEWERREGETRETLRYRSHRRSHLVRLQRCLLRKP